MKKILFMLFFSVILSANLSAQTLPSVEIPALPKSVEEFIQMRDKIAQTPQGGAAMFIVALLVYTENENLGKQMLTIAVEMSKLSDDAKGYKGKSVMKSDMSLIASQVGPDSKKAFVVKSYFRDTKTENWYALPNKLILDFSSNNYSGDAAQGVFKVFVKCSGADSPRPITLSKNDKGLWKAKEWSSLLVGIKVPKPKDDF
jgi:hypothetical protein